MAKIDLLPEGMTISPAMIAEIGGSPVSYRIGGKIAKLIAEKGLKGKVSSYPVYRDGKCYDLDVDFDEDLVWYSSYIEGTNTYECGTGVAPKKKGYKVDYDFDLFEIVVPMVMRLKSEYDLMEQSTEKTKKDPMMLNECRAGGEYTCLHEFEDLVIEEIVLDTDTMIVSMFCGS